MSKKKVVLLWGLPGSGKTTYAKEQAEEGVPKHSQKNKTSRIDLDSIARGFLGSRRTEREIQELTIGEIQNAIGSTYSRADTVILDGLITTNQSADKILSLVTKYVGEDLDFEIVFWEEDRETCRFNDRGRRSKDSKITIDNMILEEPSQNLLTKYKATMKKKKVVRKHPWQVWAAEQCLGESGFLESDTWCLGGTWGNCWGDHGTVSSTPQPASFREFDELLEKVCPNITFLQYKNIHNECVTTKTTLEWDYYGGSSEYARYVCDVMKLYELLVEKKLIEPE